MIYFYIILAVFVALGLVFMVQQEIRWQRHLSDMAKEVRERGNG